MTQIAHAGHWIVNSLYAAPVVVIVIALMIQKRRDRLRDMDTGHDTDAG